MAFFKFRKGGDESPASPAQADTVEDLRRRARHRLIGAAVLVGIGIVGFPLLFDTQPRPVAVDIPIEIPDRAKARPLPPPAPAAKAQGTAGESPRPASAPAVAAAPEGKPAPATVAKAEPAAKPVEAARPEPAPKPADAAKPAPEPARPPPVAKPAPKDDGQRAAALLEGKPVEAGNDAAAADARYIVQIGAFADAAKAQEARHKLERAGLKTYAQVVDTKDGKRTRVRVGPFASKAEAEKAAGKVKGLDLQARVLTL